MVTYLLTKSVSMYVQDLYYPPLNAGLQILAKFSQFYFISNISIPQVFARSKMRFLLWEETFAGLTFTKFPQSPQVKHVNIYK